MWGSLPLRYAPFIVMLFHRPWRRIWSTLPAIRADEPQLICVFLVGPDTKRRGGLTDRFPMRKVRPFLYLAGRFYLHFELSPSYNWFCPGGSAVAFPYEKCLVLLGMAFLKEMSPIYRMMLKMLGFGGRITDFGVFGSNHRST
ncbi:hypothetical protein [Absidia glauca]|uniref:Uncharacterized protein n=1 Tax=Absidia glauca TaxID=4829 RepID=A0A168PBW2_ABSGL|nr:hypothetical protein [Absidia glauca]